MDTCSLNKNLEQINLSADEYSYRPYSNNLSRRTPHCDPCYVFLNNLLFQMYFHIWKRSSDYNGLIHETKIAGFADSNVTLLLYLSRLQ
jgi:hypothetical protein